MEVKNTPRIYQPKHVELKNVQPLGEHVPLEKQITPSMERVSKEVLEEKVEGMNRFIEPTFTSVRFKLHEQLNDYYVEIVDTDSGEVLKEIPQKKFLDMYASMAELVGLFVDERK